jgi:hypothetical protein
MAASFVLAAGSFPANAADGLPIKVGDCVRTSIAGISQRLEDGRTHAPIALSGSAVRFANGLYQVSYDQVSGINKSRVGDPVSVCLIRLPKNCPPGDDRGKTYKTVNLRSHKSWILPDAEHMCGGA